VSAVEQAVDTGAQTVEQAATPAALSREHPRGRPVGEWGMLLFISTEATLFACLLASNYYIWFSRGGAWPPDGIEEPKLLKPLIMTALLLVSSGPMIWGDLAIRRGKPGQLKAAIPITMVLGITFLALQGTEYAEKVQTFTWTTNAYGSLFYVITGFHGFHVFTGLIMLSFTEIAALAGKFTGTRHERVRMVALYWHVVDVIWIAILFTLYISPHL
jgi:heme/copper-type cytochrome/quinol oxidase subunit 3